MQVKSKKMVATVDRGIVRLRTKTSTDSFASEDFVTPKRRIPQLSPTASPRNALPLALTSFAILDTV